MLSTVTRVALADVRGDTAAFLTWRLTFGFTQVVLGLIVALTTGFHILFDLHQFVLVPVSTTFFDYRTSEALGNIQTRLVFRVFHRSIDFFQLVLINDRRHGADVRSGRLCSSRRRAGDERGDQGDRDRHVEHPPRLHG